MFSPFWLEKIIRLLWEMILQARRRTWNSNGLTVKLLTSFASEHSISVKVSCTSVLAFSWLVTVTKTQWMRRFLVIILLFWYNVLDLTAQYIIQIWSVFYIILALVFCSPFCYTFSFLSRSCPQFASNTRNNQMGVLYLLLGQIGPRTKDPF